MAVTDQEPLDFGDESTVRTLNAIKRKFEASRDKAASEENASERALSSQLILLATVLITGNLIVLSDGGVLELLTVPHKALTLLGLLLLFSSIFAGILYCLKGFLSFKQSGDNEQKIITYIEKKEYETIADLNAYVKNAYTHLTIHTPIYWLRAQIVCLVAAFCICFVLISAVFFDFGMGNKVMGMLPVDVQDALCKSEAPSKQEACIQQLLQG